MNARLIGRTLLGASLFLGFSGLAFASTPSNFSQLSSNVSGLEFEILKIVQIVVTLAGILLAFRGVIHLKQHAHGSPQEKHLPKGIANIVFAAILFMVVPLVHMLVGTLTSGAGAGGSDYNSWDAAGANTAGAVVSAGT